MPIELFTWAKAYALGSGMILAQGFQYQHHAWAAGAQWVPAALERLQTSQSGIYVNTPWGYYYRGQTPLGKGQFIRVHSAQHQIQYFHQNNQHWIEWSGNSSFGLKRIVQDHQGWLGEGRWHNWTYVLRSGGQGQLTFAMPNLSVRAMRSRSQWQSAIRIRQATLQVFGHSQWNSTRLLFQQGGHQFFFQETHGKEGLNLVLYGRLQLHQNIIWGQLPFGEAQTPWVAGWRHVNNGKIQAEFQTSSSTLFRTASGSIWLGPTWRIGLQKNPIGWQFIAQHPSIRIAGRWDYFSIEVRHHFKFRQQTSIELHDVVILKDPELHIVTQGMHQYPSFLLYVLDEHGNEYPVHLLSGEDQWKWHLPEGTYTWKKPQRSTAPGYTVLFSPEAFTLKRGLTTDQVVQVAKQKTSIHWL